MKKLFLLPFAALAALAACSDNPTGVMTPMPGTPLFDNVQNQGTLLSGNTATIQAGGSAMIQYRLVGTGGDGGPNNPGPNGNCNVSAANKGTLTITAPAGVTASPSSLEFTECGVYQNVTFSSSTQGNYSITHAMSGGQGTYTNQADFTLVVQASTPTDNTAPVITPSIAGTLGSNGWYVSDVTLSWAVKDNESAISSTSGCDPITITADQAATEYTCTATSAGGTSTQKFSIKRDATAPTISGSRSPAENANGWSNTNVTVSFTCSDDLSGVASCESDVTVSSEGEDQSVTGTATDEAGNTATATVSSISIDKTAPTANASTSPAATAHGWNNSAVTVSFSGTDGLSGIDSCSADVELSSEGANQTASGTCTDKAGNVSAAATKTVNIDLTKPTVSLVGGPANGGSYYFGSVPAAPTCSASDALSGIDGDCSVSGYGTTVGTHTVAATVRDKAGNENSMSVTYEVKAWTLSGFYRPVVMGTDVVNSVKGGSTVPLKFEVFAGSAELTSTSISKSFVQSTVTCGRSTAEDEVEVTTTGGTSLRYDATEGQFIQNWQTPKKPGVCLKVTMTTQDGSSISALFKLK
jgi:hypothetical protein